jgi:CDP-diacylglycerol---glycerol-3-phosphate 3-phosphatidyltransferase
VSESGAAAAAAPAFVAPSDTVTAIHQASFGPSALATPANAITTMRLLLAIPLLLLIADRTSSWALFALWFVLCSTDGIDGILARRQGTTRSGAFLDPLADKVLVLGAMVMLVAAGELWWLPVALIGLREATISGFRSYWGRRGLAVPATPMAKLKTVTQEVAVGFVALPWTTNSRWLINTTLWAAVVLTTVSGARYLQAGSRATRLDGSADRDFSRW